MLNGCIAGRLAVYLLLSFCSYARAATPIDRRALIDRHDVVLTNPDPLSLLQVGNGNFAFNTDITGLQTFPEAYTSGPPLETLSGWGWHSFPNTGNYRLEDALTNYDAHGRQVSYAESHDGAKPGELSAHTREAIQWLRVNPHRFNLGRLGFLIFNAAGKQVDIQDLKHVKQTLQLWDGRLTSVFEVDGTPVHVITIVHPERDVLAVHIESSLLATRKLGVSLRFPYAADSFGGAANWKAPDRHKTSFALAAKHATIRRQLDDTTYAVRLAWSAGRLTTQQHRCDLFAEGKESLDFVVEFASGKSKERLPEFAEIEAATSKHWRHFWQSGGAIDFSGSTDPRAAELERRVVLSQYLTAVNNAANMPPQETGLIMSSWYGKAHLEMFWWHAAHFALWGRAKYLERGLLWYNRIAPLATQTAIRQGYKGARWPKMVGPDGRESPSDIGDFLIWQQPHPIYLAELLYHANPTAATLRKFKDLVFETAEFMATYAVWDQSTSSFVLGPPLVPAQESYGKIRSRVMNPTYELAYWQWALRTAQQWRTRLHLPSDAQWAKVAEGLASPHVRNGSYDAIGIDPFTVRTDHPSMLGAFGFLPPTSLIRPDIMRGTLQSVVKDWDWKTTWGWDYPMMAMTAARLNDPSQAVDLLLIDKPKNVYIANGNNYQTPRLPVYLPGNGGLLYAVAMMAAGWADAPRVHAPGFPKNGGWNVRFEGIRPAL